MRNDDAVKALDTIRLHAGFAGALAKDAKAARHFLGKLKPLVLALVHPDANIGGAKLEVDSGEISAAFDTLGSLEDDELISVLADYNATFSDASQAILSLRTQLSKTLPALRQDKARLEEELGRYKENEGWLIEKSRRDNDRFTIDMLDKFAQVFLRRVNPVELEAEHGLKQEVTLFETPSLYLIAESSMDRKGVGPDHSDETSALELLDVPVIGCKNLTITVDKSGHAAVSEFFCYPGLAEGVDINSIPVGKEFDNCDLGWADLDEVLAKRLEAGEHIANTNATVRTGLLIGFFNPVEMDESAKVALSEELASRYIHSFQGSLRDIADDILPTLSNNALIRRQVDPKNGQALQCRIRSYLPKTTFYSTYAVILSSTQYLDLWEATFVPIGTAIGREK